MNFQLPYLDKLLELGILFIPKIGIALLVVFIGLFIIRRVTNLITSACENRSLDPSLMRFSVSLVDIVLKLLLGLTVAGYLGIEMTSFIAILTAAGLAVGMALSGTLQNFAGGVVILVLRPFKVGDVIEAMGYIGTVSSIQVFNTVLKTPDNKTIFLPNSGVSGSTLVNYSSEPTRRVDFTIGIDYGDDIDLAKSTLEAIISEEPRILKDPEHTIAVKELADSSVNFTVRVWVNSADYWGVYFDGLETIKKRFDAAGLNFPFPQLTVHRESSS